MEAGGWIAVLISMFSFLNDLLYPVPGNFTVLVVSEGFHEVRGFNAGFPGQEQTTQSLLWPKLKYHTVCSMVTMCMILNVKSVKTVLREKLCRVMCCYYHCEIRNSFLPEICFKTLVNVLVYRKIQNLLYIILLFLKVHIYNEL